MAGDLRDEVDLIEEAKLKEAGQRLKAYCQQSRVEVEEAEDTFFGGIIYQVKVPNGRDRRVLSVGRAATVDALINVGFKDYIFIGRYIAICSYTHDLIEAAVRPFGPGVWQRLERALALNRPESETDEEGAELDIDIQFKHAGEKIAAVLSPPSPVFREMAMVNPGASGRITLKIQGAGVTQYDQALNVLEMVSNSVFFHMDMVADCPMGLMPYRLPRLLKGDEPPSVASQLEFPAHSYDASPSALYWYGRHSTGMPLLQFLAYYQCVEYYFPVYSQLEAKKQVRNIIKRPSFRSDVDADIMQILSAVKSGPTGFGDEQTQLRATIQECLSPDVLREYLTEREARAAFFSKKAAGLTDKKLSIGTPGFDLRNEVADRIYNIRCKIVHAKAGFKGESGEMILPFSPQADMLKFDIDLIRFIARSVLISASTPLRL